MKLTHHPVLGKPIITQPFGPPNWNAVYSTHTGIDFGGTFPVVAAAGGKVIFAGVDTNADPIWKGGYGKYVVIDHGEEVQTLYGHLNNFTVEVGEKVVGGQQIGVSDSTGYSTGPHLHFGLKSKKVWIDPAPYLRDLGKLAPLAVGTKLTATADSVNMRTLPGYKGLIVGELYYGATVTVLEPGVDKDGLVWVKVEVPPVYMALATSEYTLLEVVHG